MRQRFQSVGCEATGDVIRPFFLQSRKRGLQPSLIGIHYSAGRVSALLWEQFEQITQFVGTFNRPFRLKGEVSETVVPYPPLALKELIVNAFSTP